MVKTNSLKREPWEITRAELLMRDITSLMPAYPFKWRGLDGETRYAKTETRLRKLMNDDILRHRNSVLKAARQGLPVSRKVTKDIPGLEEILWREYSNPEFFNKDLGLIVTATKTEYKKKFPNRVLPGGRILNISDPEWGKIFRRHKFEYMIAKYPDLQL